MGIKIKKWKMYYEIEIGFVIQYGSLFCNNFLN